MAGISSKSAGKVENKTKYNGYEFNSDFDINLYETFYRSHDPQIGRFWQLDPKPNNSESPYTSMANNPILNFDLLGDTARIGAERNGADGQSDINRFIQMIGKTTGNTYEMRDGKLVRTNKTLNTESNGEISGTLLALVEFMITSESNISFTVANSEQRDADITYDIFESGTVDLRDYSKAEQKGGNAFLAAMLGHTFDEHSMFPNLKDRNHAARDKAHLRALSTETNIMSEILGLSLTTRKEKSWGKDEVTLSGVPISINKYDYGKVLYIQTQVILRKNQGIQSQPYTSGIIEAIYPPKK